MKKYMILKLIGLAVLTMITLVMISFLEVAVYSYLINPGHELASPHCAVNQSLVVELKIRMLNKRWK